MKRTVLSVALLIGTLYCATNVEAVTEADCYLKDCQISLDIRDNTNDIVASLSNAGGNLNASIFASEDAIKETATTEIEQLETKVAEDINTCTGMLNSALDSAKADIMSNLASVCQSSEFKISDAQSLLVELDVYSGVPNPTWTVGSGAGDFSAVVSLIALSKSTSLPVTAGYRGFIVTVQMVNGAAVIYKFGARQQTSLETMLLNSNSGLDATLISVVTAGINSQTPPDLGFVGPLPLFQLPLFNPQCGKANTCVDPDYPQTIWGGQAQISNNCYNYALNVPTNTYAQPGRNMDLMYTSVTGLEVRNAMVNDGLMDFDDPAPGVFPESNNCLTALMIMENLDFHLLRQDINGLWSHKLGTNLPINTDNSGNTISDPRLADLGPYQFVRFIGFCVRKYRGIA